MDQCDNDLFEAFSDSDAEQRCKKKMFLGKKRSGEKKKISKSINDLLDEDNTNPKSTTITKQKEAIKHKGEDEEEEEKKEDEEKEAEVKEDEDLVLAQSINKILTEEESQVTTDEPPENMNMIIESFELSGCVHENIREKQFKGSFSLVKDPKLLPAAKYPFKLDAFQERAILCLENRQSVLVAAHTSAGKTAVAQYAIAMALRDGQRVIYTSPIKALSNQKYRELAHEFKNVGLMTGDVTLNPTAGCLVMTTEILRNMLYKGSEITREMAWVIFDEVHYMRDKDRGVVWEETIILLSNKINYVFLSATIPNAREFAMWVSKLKSQPCNVVYTDFRPVPLQHYIYTPEGKGLFLIVDSNGTFREGNFDKALESVNKSLQLDNYVKEKQKKKSNDHIRKIVSLITQNKLDPAIVFSFSKRECEDNALKLKHMDFTTEEEKEAITTIYTNAVLTLAEEDQELDEIKNMLPILLQGVGIHHGGMLPILKECVELIFQEGLMKVLFSTETFSMGINMPAKTVIFTAIEKWDGEQNRYLSGGEYIQMSGRAGRRGIDDRGITIIMLITPIEPMTCKNILNGVSDPLNSSFHLNYNQLVNLFRIEGMESEYIVKRSFRQFQSERSVPLLKKELAQLYNDYKQYKFNQAREEAINDLLKIRLQIEEFKEQNRKILIQADHILPYCCPGRLVKINNWGYGIVVNYSMKSIELLNKEKKCNIDLEIKEEIESNALLYVIDIIVLFKDHVDLTSKLIPASLDEKDNKIGIVPFLLQSLEAISPIKINLPQNLKENSNMDLVHKMLNKLFNDFGTTNIPLMDPIKDIGITDETFIQNLEKTAALKKKKRAIEKGIKERSGVAISSDEEDKYAQKLQLRKRIKEAIEKYYSMKKLVLFDELNSIKRVLRRLEFVKDDVVTLKGQIACNISTGDELLLTEMLFEGTFNELPPEELASVLTCFLDNEGGATKSNSNDDKEQGYDNLTQLHEKIKVVAKRVSDILSDCKIEVDQEEFIQKFKNDFMIPIYKWSKGATFGELQNKRKKDIYEGQLIRCIRRLDELIKQVSESAQQIGNFLLKEKLEKASSLIRRGLPFAGSLYFSN